MRKAVRIRISAELLREWMPLPITATIEGSLRSEHYGEIEIVVTDPSFRELKEGEELPIASPTLKKNAPVEFVDWGIYE